MAIVINLDGGLIEDIPTNKGIIVWSDKWSNKL